MSGTADPTASEFDIVLDGETYTFRKPGIRMPMELGYRAADIRRRAYPAAGGSIPGDFGLDMDSVNFSRACAILELYLVRSDQTWPYTAGADGKPQVDFDKFPPDREGTVRDLGLEFEVQVSRFRARRPASTASGSAQAVAGQSNPG